MIFADAYDFSTVNSSAAKAQGLSEFSWHNGTMAQQLLKSGYQSGYAAKVALIHLI